MHRRDGFRSSKIMLKRVQDHPKIHLKLHRIVKRYVGVERMESDDSCGGRILSSSFEFTALSIEEYVPLVETANVVTSVFLHR